MPRSELLQSSRWSLFVVFLCMEVLSPLSHFVRLHKETYQHSNQPSVKTKKSLGRQKSILFHLRTIQGHLMNSRTNANALHNCVITMTQSSIRISQRNTRDMKPKLSILGRAFGATEPAEKTQNDEERTGQDRTRRK